jgi:hypothetical protein
LSYYDEIRSLEVGKRSLFDEFRLNVEEIVKQNVLLLYYALYFL